MQRTPPPGLEASLGFDAFLGEEGQAARGDDFELFRSPPPSPRREDSRGNFPTQSSFLEFVDFADTGTHRNIPVIHPTAADTSAPKIHVHCTSPVAFNQDINHGNGEVKILPAMTRTDSWGETRTTLPTIDKLTSVPPAPHILPVTFDASARPKSWRGGRNRKPSNSRGHGRKGMAANWCLPHTLPLLQLHPTMPMWLSGPSRMFNLQACKFATLCGTQKPPIPELPRPATPH